MIVYKCTHTDSGKAYIGCTTFDIDVRIKRHVNSSNRGSKVHFHNAIRKYGIESFSVEILEKCSTTEEMFDREIYYIDQYQTYENGYNMTKGGEARTLGISQPIETKNKISQSLKKANLGGDAHYRTGTKRSLSERRKMSEGRRGKCMGSNHPKAQPVYVFKDGMKYKFDSTVEAAIKLDINKNTMRNLLNSGKYSDKYKVRVTKCHD